MYSQVKKIYFLVEDLPCRVKYFLVLDFKKLKILVLGRYPVHPSIYFCVLSTNSTCHVCTCTHSMTTQSTIVLESNGRTILLGLSSSHF